jgi:hypothetical protein
VRQIPTSLLFHEGGPLKRPPRTGVNVILICAQVAPVQRRPIIYQSSDPNNDGGKCLALCFPFNYMIVLLFSKDQLWRLLVASAVGPGSWTEEGTNEGKLVKYESRQLGGFEV